MLRVCVLMTFISIFVDIFIAVCCHGRSNHGGGHHGSTWLCIVSKQTGQIHHSTIQYYLVQLDCSSTTIIIFVVVGFHQCWGSNIQK